MHSYNIAVIGGGFMGKTHSLCAASLPFYYDCDFKAVLDTLCSKDPQNTRRRADRYGFLHWTTDFESVIQNPDIDVIDICTPNYLHYSQAQAAILAGKHVYCDKPLCVNARQAHRLAELAEKSGKVCQVTFQHRFWPAMMQLKQLVDSQAIGQIISFRAVFLHSSLVDPDKPYAWRNAPVSEGGGVLNDLGSHLLDLICYICPQIDSISSVTQTLYPSRRCGTENIEISSDDAAYMLIRLKNGACGTAEVSKLATGMNDVLKLEIHGDSGALMFDLSTPGQLKYYDLKDGKQGGFKTIDCMQKYGPPCDFLTGAVIPGWIRAHIHSYFCFLNNIDKGLPPCPSFSDAAKVQDLIQQARNNCAF